jgi:hypothetical protein
MKITNSCGARKRGCKTINLPIFKIVAMPKEIACDEIESYEILRKAA